jgi:Fur family peroxide stress response transcriptional regulator
MLTKSKAAKSERERAKQNLRSNLSASGYQFTRQRAVVFDYLQSVDHHPTAEEVFLAVKSQLPKISLATVYKNLEALVESGVASKWTYANAAARYDIRTDHHYHLRCLRCGRMWDVEPTEVSQLLANMQPQRGFQVSDYRLEFVGTCRECRQ